MSTMASRASRPDTLPVLPPGGVAAKRSRSVSGVDEAPKRTVVHHTRYVWSGSSSDIPRPNLLGFICSGDSNRRASCSSQPAAPITTTIRRSSTTVSTTSTESLNALMDPGRRRRERRGSSVESTKSNCSLRSVTGRSVKTPIGSRSSSPAMKRRNVKLPANEPLASGAASAAEPNTPCAAASPISPPSDIGASHHRNYMRGGQHMSSSYMDRMANDIPHHLEELERQLGLTSSMSSFSTISTLDVDSADLNMTRLELEMELEDDMLTPNDSFEDLLTDAELSHVSHAITREMPKLSTSDQELDIRYQRLVAWANEAAKIDKSKPSPVTEPEIDLDMIVAANTTPRVPNTETPQEVVDEPQIMEEFVESAKTCPSSKKREVSPPIVPLVAPQAVVEIEILPIEIQEAEITPTFISRYETPPSPSIDQSIFQQESSEHLTTRAGETMKTSNIEISESEKDSQFEMNSCEILPQETLEQIPDKAEEILPLTEQDIPRLSDSVSDREMSPPEVTEISEDQESWNRIEPEFKTVASFETETPSLLSHPTPQTVAMETDWVEGGVDGCGGGGLGGGEGALGESAAGGSWGTSTSGISPDGWLPPPPPPPPPTPSPPLVIEASVTPPLSSIAGSITTISTSGLMETEFSDLLEVSVPVQIISDDGEEVKEKDDILSAGAPPGRDDENYTPPGGGFYNYTDQYDSLPGYYPSEGEVDSPRWQAGGDPNAYRVGMGESDYIGEDVDAHDYSRQEPEVAVCGAAHPLEGEGEVEREVSGGGYREVLDIQEEVKATMEADEEHQYDQQSGEEGDLHSNITMTKHSIDDVVHPTTPHQTTTTPYAGSTDITPPDHAPVEKPKLKGILKKTSSFDVKEPEPERPVGTQPEALKEVNSGMVLPEMVSKTESQPPPIHVEGDTTGESEQQQLKTQLDKKADDSVFDDINGITSFPSLSDVMHAKSYDPSLLDARTRLTLLDTVINFLLLTPLTVLFYHSTCRLLQMSLLRALPLLGPWLLLLCGGTIEFIASFCQRSIAVHAPKPEVGRPPFADVNLLFLVTAKGFNFVLGFGNVCHMLAMSSLVDMYVGVGFREGIRVALTALVVLWTLRCGRNVVAAPLYIGVDEDDPRVFASTTMFRVEPDMTVESAADILGTIGVMISFVHLHWAGVWNCADAILFPSYFTLSMVTSLILGSSICLLFLLLQRQAGEISRNLERSNKEPLRIVFENAFNTTANIGVILLWRGLWMVYDVMAHYFPIYCRSWDIAPLAAGALSFLLLALAHCSSSLLFKGCEVDGDLRRGAGVSFTTGYFTEILQGHWDTDLDESGSTIKPTPEKPAAASSAIPSQVLNKGIKTQEATEQPIRPNGSTPTLKQKFA